MNLRVLAGGVVLQLVLQLLCHLQLTSPAIGMNPFSDLVEMQFSAQRLDQCFCELKGQVDDCCCDVETVDTLNTNQIYPLITSLVNRTFFRFFRVNMQRSCPFWQDDGRCVLKDCHVEECPEEDVPGYLKGDKDMGRPEDCDAISEEEVELSTVNQTISQEQWEVFINWQDFDSTEDNFCEIDAESGNGLEELSYVDLRLNPERYTGYSGHSPQRVWKAIYHENCFKPQDSNRISSSLPLFNSSLLQDMCLEKRAFFRIVSGLHASINIHVSAKYLIPGGKKATFGPNLNEFVRRFDSATTNGQGPSWLKNLYFAYLLTLRAIVKAEPYWKAYQFYTGEEQEDQGAKDLVARLLQAAKSCSSLFDESMLFTGNSSSSLKAAFKSHFKNISHIMDCVGCDKCKLWGKLQVQGLGTALKILFSDRKHGPPLHLSRMELVALFNVLERFSSSIHFFEVFKEIQAKTSGAGETHKSRGEL